MKKKKLIIILVLLIILTAIGIYGYINTSNVNELADKVIFGTIYTGDDNLKEANAVAIKGDTIVYVGNENDVKKYIGKKTEVTEFKNGELITSAFVDGHTHSTEYVIAANANLCTIEDGATKEECVETIKKYIEENPDLDFIIANGWNNSAFGELGPTADLLDSIDTDKPILASSSDGHSYWVNTKLINMANVTKDTEDPEGGVIIRYKDGTPSGCFKDTAEYIIDKVKPNKTEETYKSGIAAADTFNINQGYLIRFQAGDNEQYDLTKAPVIEYSEEMDKAGELSTYTQASFIINNYDNAVKMVDKAIEYRNLTKGGNFEVNTIKIFLDGIVENEGAYLSDAYSNNSKNYGSPRWEGEESIKRMSEVIAKANENGMTVHFHAMGDQATNDALKAIEMAAEKIGIEKVKEARNAFVHLALVKDEDYEKMAKYNVIAVLNPWGVKDPSYYADQVSFLGEERAAKQYPYKSFIKNGINISFGTDFGASFTYNSIECFHVLTTRASINDDPETILNADEKLTREQALNAMTKGGAYQLKKENEFGTITVGKQANIVVLSQNLLTIPDDEIMNTEIINTMYKGKWNKQKEEVQEKNNSLPMEISQEDWESSKKFVDLSTGITMAYVEMGNPDGQPIILQHGMTDNSRSWSLAASYFTEAGYHVYLPDLRGMGKTDAPDGYYTPITYATDLEAFFDAMGIEKAILVGHSLGSFTVQNFSIMFPERCEKIVLVSSIPQKNYQNEALLAAYKKYIEPLNDDEHPSDAFMDSWYATNLKEDEFQEVFDTFLANMKKEAQSLSAKAWKNIFLGMMAGNIETLYSQIDTTIPVLVLHGDDDTMTITQYQKELCTIFNVNENSYRNYEGIGHNIQFEIPKKCANDIITWIENGELPINN